MRLPPSSSRALGSPPMRVLRPPAWITPVIFIMFRSPRMVGPQPHDVLRLALPYVQCNGSLTQHAGRVDGYVDDRGGRAAGRWAPVEHQVENVTEVGEHAVGRGRRIAAGGICARRRH